ncbi:MAG: transposase, partial [Ktedonobacterales bacterium]
VVGTGLSWREMPAEYGKWETAYKRYRLWCDEGRWPHILEALETSHPQLVLLLSDWLSVTVGSVYEMLG